mgnify:CR=1 FL=1
MGGKIIDEKSNVGRREASELLMRLNNRNLWSKTLKIEDSFWDFMINEMGC